MGMFSPLPERFNDKVGEDVLFRLKAARVISIPTQDYGDREAVEMDVDLQGGESAVVTSFGAGLVAQVKRMAPGDLPAMVSVVRVPSGKPGRQAVRLFVPDGVDPATMRNVAGDALDDDIRF